MDKTKINKLHRLTERDSRLAHYFALLGVWGYILGYLATPLHSTPLTGRAIKPQCQGHVGRPIAQPCVCVRVSVCVRDM